MGIKNEEFDADIELLKKPVSFFAALGLGPPGTPSVPAKAAMTV
jgi:hypothetical protein